MLTKLVIRNFKPFENVEIELGSNVLFIGPNNSGKTSAVQALALWHAGLQAWLEKRDEQPTPRKRPGVAVNRLKMTAIPMGNAKQLWRDLHVRDVRSESGKQQTHNVRIDVLVEGVSQGRAWQCGLEFDYANEESFFCRALRAGDAPAVQDARSTHDDPHGRMPIPDAARNVRVAFLPPMSGLTSQETLLQPGAIQVRLGEGRTAEVLRNLCYQVHERDAAAWEKVVAKVELLFGVRLQTPRLVPQRGEIEMTYRTPRGITLDLTCSGRGLQQTLLVLAHLQANPECVLLLDEPDAHLEILRQRQIYAVLTETARELGSQLLIASHSEVLLNEAADRDVVVAFVGAPHRIDDRGSQVAKALKEIGFEHYYQAELAGWVLYLEGSTDLQILRAFAATLNHPAAERLARPYVHYVGANAGAAREHFHGLREAKRDLSGFALFDRLERALNPAPPLVQHCWRRREIENYLCQPQTLLRYAAAAGRLQAGGALFAETWTSAMQECIQDFATPAALRDPADAWWNTVKATDEFLDRIFPQFFTKLGLPRGTMRKTDYHELAPFVPRELLDDEVSTVLDLIEQTAQAARPAQVE